MLREKENYNDFLFAVCHSESKSTKNQEETGRTTNQSSQQDKG